MELPANRLGGSIDQEDDTIKFIKSCTSIVNY